MRKTSWGLTLTLSAIILGQSATLALAKGNPIDRQVQQKFEHAYQGLCDTLEPNSVFGPAKAIINVLEYKLDYEEANQAPHQFRLYNFPCYSGAYNFSSVYYGVNEYDEIKQIHFAFPELDIVHTNDTDEAVKSITITGFNTHEALTNSGFNEETGSLFSFSKWRGLADASSSGEWIFQRGKFVLVTFDVDASYDGEMNPVRVYGEGKASSDY